MNVLYEVAQFRGITCISGRYQVELLDSLQGFDG